ncbi:hypothetical protein JZ751_023441, partial [Albula glossodonta]
VVKSDTDGEGASEVDGPTEGSAVQGQRSVPPPAPDDAAEPQTLQFYSTGSSCQNGSEGWNKDKPCSLVEPHSVSDKCLQRTAKVVYIVEQKHSRAATGFIKFLPDKNFAMFSPVDHRVPRVNVPLTDCPTDFALRPGDYANTLFICRITSWPDNSTFAEGRLVKSLGQAGEIEPETEGILLEYDVDFSEFSEDVLQCLPQNLPWTIPPDELSKRRDL